MPESFDLTAAQGQLTVWVTLYGVRVVAGILILILGWLVAGWASKRVRHVANRAKAIDSTLEPLLAKAVRVTILSLTGIIVLNRFGIETTSLIAVLGAAGLAIGLALQGTLSTVASGIMLLTLRPIEVGDRVEVGGTVAIVDEIGLMVTKMHTPDNVFVAMPNSQIWGKEIRNHSRNPLRRVDMVFGIGYGDDMTKAMEIIRRTLDADDRVLEEPEPLVAVGELADSSVNILARPWVKSSDFLSAKLALTQRVKERFDENGVSIPFPQRDVHLFAETASGGGEDQTSIA